MRRTVESYFVTCVADSCHLLGLLPLVNPYPR